MSHDYRIEQPTPKSLVVYRDEVTMLRLTGGQVLVISAKFHAALERSQAEANLYCEGVIDGILQVAAEGHEDQDTAPPEEPPFPATIGEA